MRILLDLQACQAASMNRGIGRYSLALALAIARNAANHELCIVLNNAFPDSAILLRKAFDGLVPANAITSFSTPVPTAEVDPRNGWRLQAAERIRERYIASLRPDLVHVSSLFEGLSDDSVISLLHGENRFDTSFTLYDVIPLLHKERYLADPNVAAWYHRKLVSLRNAELLVSISAHARAEAIDALSLAPENIVNISSAADPMFQPRVLMPDVRAALMARLGLRRPFIMYTGGIDYRKNIEGLIAAYAALPGALRQQYQLAVVCSVREPDRLRLQRLAAKLSLAPDDLVLTGYISDDDLVSLYSCTALFVFPSLHEGFGLPVLEAMACGAPVIASNTTSIPEVVGRADATFDPLSVPAMTAALAGVLCNPAFADALRAHSLVRARLFSWDASARRAIEAFEATHLHNTAARTFATGHGTVASPAMERPRLALVGPDSAGLAGVLTAFYDIDLIWVGDMATTPVEEHGMTWRNVEWFDAHLRQYERVVYQFANTTAHAPMFALLERHPGIVMLHDFFLSEAIDHVQPDAFFSVLYQSHGYGALVRERVVGRVASRLTYPCNKSVLDRATGVLVPGRASLALAQHWYGPQATREWQVAEMQDERAGPLLYNAIEAVTRDAQGAAQQRMLRSIASVTDGIPAAGDRVQVAAAIAANRQRIDARQVLIDVTDAGLPEEIMQQRHELIAALIHAAPPVWRIEPVCHDGRRYRYARGFTLALLGMTGRRFDDAVADPGPRDVFLAADADATPPLPAAWEASGVAIWHGAWPAVVDKDVNLMATRLLGQLSGLPAS